MTRRGASMISRPVQASRLFVKLPYYDDINLIATNTATYGEYIFSQDGIYDPDITVTGHQPRGRDQYAALYENYLVHGLKYKFTIRVASSESNSTTAGPFTWGLAIGPENYDFQFTTLQDIMEYPKSKFLRRKNLLTRASSTDALYSGYYATPGQYTIYGYVSTKSIHKYYGGNDNSTGQTFTYPTDYKAAVGANPSANNFLVLYAASLQDLGIAAKNLPALNVQAELVYYVEFMTPLFPTAS